MNWYITRIELNEANSSDYYDLHDYMEEQGFSKTIISNKKIEYHLIDGEYFFKSSDDLTTRQVLNRAKIAIQKINKSFKIFVSKISSISWEGLEKVED